MLANLCSSRSSVWLCRLAAFENTNLLKDDVADTWSNADELMRITTCYHSLISLRSLYLLYRLVTHRAFSIYWSWQRNTVLRCEVGRRHHKHLRLTLLAHVIIDWIVQYSLWDKIVYFHLSSFCHKTAMSTHNRSTSQPIEAKILLIWELICVWLRPADVRDWAHQVIWKNIFVHQALIPKSQQIDNRSIAEPIESESLVSEDPHCELWSLTFTFTILTIVLAFLRFTPQNLTRRRPILSSRIRESVVAPAVYSASSAISSYAKSTLVDRCITRG